MRSINPRTGKARVLFPQIDRGVSLFRRAGSCIQPDPASHLWIWLKRIAPAHPFNHIDAMSTLATASRRRGSHLRAEIAAVDPMTVANACENACPPEPKVKR